MIEHVRPRAAVIAAALAATGVSAPAVAGPNSVSGTVGNLTYTASSYIIGQTSTATQAAPTPPGTVGNPIYNPVRPFDNGVVALIMNEGAAGSFICSGSLMSDRIHILTAGHCISSGNGVITPISTTATFYGGLDPDAVVGTTGTPAAGAVTLNIAAYSVNPLYSGDVIDDHDVAVLTLAQAAPAFANGYDLYTGNLIGQEYNVAGYGRRSDQGGSVGADLGTGRLRQGDNRFDTTLGDPVFQGLFTASFFGGTNGETTYSYIADFDNGLAANDGICKLVTVGFGGPATSQYCNLGVGPLEVSTAGGDSGGPEFINGRVAAVTSYGLTFGTTYGDIDGTLNDTFGELNGFVSVGYNLGYISRALASGPVPEPATWAMMIAGFGMIGAMARRRRGIVFANA